MREAPPAGHHLPTAYRPFIHVARAVQRISQCGHVKQKRPWCARIGVRARLTVSSEWLQRSPRCPPSWRASHPPLLCVDAVCFGWPFLALSKFHHSTSSSISQTISIKDWTQESETKTRPRSGTERCTLLLVTAASASWQLPFSKANVWPRAPVDASTIPQGNSRVARRSFHSVSNTHSIAAQWQETSTGTRACTMSVRSLNGVPQPRIHPTAWIAPTAVICGDVEIGAESSVWVSNITPTHWPLVASLALQICKSLAA
jgi:hypothetical protein